MSINAQIKLNDKTSNHAETLREQGYQVTVEGETITVKANGVVEGPVDLTTIEKATESFQNIVRDQNVCTYGTRFAFPDGHERFAFPAVAMLTRSEALKDALGFDPSSLVTKVDRPNKKPRIAFPEGVNGRREKREWLAKQLDISTDGQSLNALTKQFLEQSIAPTQEEIKATQEEVDNLAQGLEDVKNRLAQVQQA